ncbi:MAG: hypothetical protein JNJ51_01365 [Methylobacillus glycogenes]|nr:hypothetical protein [Methylobacillus glycogenes]
MSQPATLNQCQWQLVLQAGVVDLVVKAHQVQLTLNGEAAGSLQFKALTSANSDETPLYRLDVVDIQAEALLALRDSLMETALQLFAQCTGAKVIVSKRLS